MTNTAIIRRLRWAITLLSLALAVATLAVHLVVLVQIDGYPLLNIHQILLPLTAITYALVGTLVISRHADNPIGWIFSTVALMMGLVSLAASYRLAGEAISTTLPGIAFMHWLDIWAWIPATALPMTFLLLLFPDGHLPSRRWWPVAWASAIGVVAYTLTTALHPHPPSEFSEAANPFGIPGAEGVLDILMNISYVFFGVGIFGSLAALGVRFRGSRGKERQQLKWLAYAGAIIIVGGIVSGTLTTIWSDDLLAYQFSVSIIQIDLSVIGIAAGIAILRHRLYDIDILINRTLLYTALSAGVVSIYVLIVGGLGALFQSSGNLVFGLVATGLAALVVQPLRAGLQRRINHLMYGERDDPYAVLSQLSQQLKTTLAPSAVLPSIAEAVAQTLKLPYVALMLKEGSRLEVAAAYGLPSGDPMQLPLVYQAETVGEMVVAPRSPGESFTPAERRLLEDIALQAGVAAHAVQLTDDLQRARERLVNAREEERRRLRRDLHDGLGPQLASLTLTVGAARELLRHDVKAADTLLQEIAGHAQSAIADIRRLVYALRPPALDDLGLVPALQEQAALYSKAGLQISINAPGDLPPLPAAVEVAAYRIVQEALTNVVRHSQARTCTVEIALASGTPGDSLDITISDDGVGLPNNGRVGVGLTSMRERADELGGTCLVESRSSGGTHITARLPLHGRHAVEGNREDQWTTSAY